MDDLESTLLSWKACRLISKNGMTSEMIGFEDYETIREYGFAGFAEYYLKECWERSILMNKADVTLYKQLLEIDAKLGVTQTEQLFKGVFRTLRMDLLVV